ncbi:VWA domain-containing protein [filamentous cyanobacterium LEGE 11480]|uniref:VWA domain-containing protein n=1 Tax=Romeriopsis navalis LEGE 11480 TaxID=2777977 RepID=A0A928VJM5_9CYAN|nr:VWA domain-containing protein [Romeriopsis navalis]MBE9028857.1 VWA domain-containing protein [Romeriopsis navalis LEGE 11480]
MKGLFRSVTQSKTSTLAIKHWQRSLLATSIGLMGVLWSSPAFAEGSAQWGLTQKMYEYGDVSAGINLAQTRISSASRSLYVDITTPGEVINISLCGASDTDALSIEIYQTTPNAIDPAFIPTTGGQVFTQNLSGSNVSCTDPMTGVMPNPVKFTAATVGTYEIRLFTTASTRFERVDVTVTPDLITPVDPTDRAGRLYSYAYAFLGDGGGGCYALSDSTSSDFFVKVPGGRPGENYVWKLDLNNFAGCVYDLVANSYGVNPPRSGFSVPFNDNNFTPEYPIYISYPAQVGSRPTQPPSVLNFTFTDNQGIDNSITPGGTIGVQDSGTFTFTTDIIGNYSIQIDVNQDGIYSPVDAQGAASGDVFLNGITNGPGTVSVPWDGKQNDGTVLPVGTYNAKVQMRAGEYHFIAGDAETSGGGSNNGLTIFEMLGPGIQTDTLVFWDDSTFLGNIGGTTTLPNGALSSTPQAKHTWGDFSSGGFGNQVYIDTYVYGDFSEATSPVIVAMTDEPGITGRVWNDADGSANNTFTNINTGSEGGTDADGLHVNLVDSTGNVIATTPVNADGTYALADVTSNQNNLTLHLSTTAGTIGQPAPALNLPVTWRATTPAIRPAFNIGTTSITDQDFGLHLINPDLTANYCQTSRNFMFVLDDSESVDATELQQQRDAVMEMLRHLARNGIASRVAIVGFDTAARTVIDYTDVNGNNLAAFQTALDNNYGVTGTGTHWKAALKQASLIGLPPTDSTDVLFFFSDGKLTTGDVPSADADLFKQSGTHMYGVWIDSDPALTVDDFKPITDGLATAEFTGTNGATADYVKVADYAALSAKTLALLQNICPGKPNLLLVKRITERNGGTTTEDGDSLSTYINESANPYDDNLLEDLYPPTNLPDTNKWPTPATFLLGGVDGGNVKPDDELEYTIYFLSTGDNDANNVLFCDRVPENVTYLPSAYSAGATAGTQLGIQLNLGGTVTNLTGTQDSDVGQFFPIGSEPTTLFPGINCGGSNTNGAVVVNLGNLPKATASATPAASYGFVRFKGKVK